MALYNLQQILDQVAQYVGKKNADGVYGFDDTTFPTSGLAVNIVNDTFREICGSWDYTFLETTKSYPFYHSIQDVQSVYLSGTNISGVSISGTITPYPSDVLNYAWLAQNTLQDVNSNFSGISFYGVDVSGNTWSGTSLSGTQTTATWTGVGYTYQMDPDIDKFMIPGIFVPHSNNGNSAQGVMIKNIDYEDMIRIFPIGQVQASGTPIYFSEAPGLSPINNNGKIIQFGPFPTATAYSGNNFVVFYKKLQQDLVNPTDTQNTIPVQWQNAIIKTAVAKIFVITNPDRAEAAALEAAKIVRAMKLWDAQQPSKTRRRRDANYGTQSSFLFDSSTWQTLGGDSSR